MALVLEVMNFQQKFLYHPNREPLRVIHVCLKLRQTLSQRYFLLLKCKISGGHGGARDLVCPDVKTSPLSGA